ncbi:CATRA conflict system CASPASE/TPR repeat-associated protein [Streptomyces sp. NPDC007901]|uniref:CATRA conflict system CASPASE/TPR repeat-associated protein n=1 Tax=Streptomyces sp. NPDC007901 TaxID=3364785 RepID=UPI0036E7482A
MTDAPAQPALLTHLWYAVDDVRWAGASAAALSQAWAAVAALGLDRPVPDLPGELRPPLPPLYPERLTVLGARAAERPGIEQAIVVQNHDVITVSVMLAPRPDTSWADLAGRWEAVAGSAITSAARGTATLFIGQTAHDLTSLESVAATARGYGPLLPSVADGRWADQAIRLHDGICLWDLPLDADDTTAAHRRLLALSPTAAEASLDRWLWSGPDPGLVPFTRYLLHACKLRYEHAVLVRDLEALRSLARESDALCTSLTRNLERGTVPPERLRDTVRALTGLQTSGTGLLVATSKLQALDTTVRAAQQNMARAMETAPVHTAPALGSDQQLIDWTLQQADLESTYLRATTDRVSHVLTLTKAAVDDMRRSRQEALTLLQTSLLGALLTALAATQSLQYKPPLDAGLYPPVIAFLTAVALWLPAAVLYWPPGSRTSARWRAMDSLTSGLVGGSLAWLAAEMSAQPPAGLSAAIGALAGVAVAGVTWVLAARRTRRLRQSDA